MNKELLQKALDALKNSCDFIFKDTDKAHLRHQAIAGLEAAIAQPAKSFDTLYKDNAQGVEIERLKMRVEELETAQPAVSDGVANEVIVVQPTPTPALLVKADKIASALRGSRVNHALEQDAAATIWELIDVIRAQPASVYIPDTMDFACIAQPRPAEEDAKDARIKVLEDALVDIIFIEQNNLNHAFKIEEIARAAIAQPTSADYAQGYCEGFEDACKPAPKAKS